MEKTKRMSVSKSAGADKNIKDLVQVIEKAKASIGSSKTTYIKSPDDIRAVEKIYHRFFPSDEGEDISRLPHFIIAFDQVLQDFNNKSNGEDTSSEDDDSDDEEDDDDSSDTSSKKSKKNSSDADDSDDSDDEDSDDGDVKAFKKSKKNKDVNVNKMQKDGLTKAAAIPPALASYINSKTKKVTVASTKKKQPDLIDQLLEEATFIEESNAFLEEAKKKPNSNWGHMLSAFHKLLAKNMRGKQLADNFVSGNYEEFSNAWEALGKDMVRRMKTKNTKEANAQDKE